MVLYPSLMYLLNHLMSNCTWKFMSNPLMQANVWRLIASVLMDINALLLLCWPMNFSVFLVLILQAWSSSVLFLFWALECVGSVIKFVVVFTFWLGVGFKFEDKTVINNYLSRAYKISSNWDDFHLEIQRIRQLLINNGFINTMFDFCLNKYFNFRFSQNDGFQKKDSAHDIKLFYKSQMHANYKVEENIIRKIINDKVKPIVKQSNVVYKFMCPYHHDTPHCYIGHTRTTLARRLTMHVQGGSIFVCKLIGNNFCWVFVWMFQLYKTEQKFYWQPKYFETETRLKYIANISKVRIRQQYRQTRNPSRTLTSRSLGLFPQSFYRLQYGVTTPPRQPKSLPELWGVISPI